MSGGSSGRTRRELLAAISVGTVAGVTGCVGRLFGEQGSPDPVGVSATIKTPPNDEDPPAAEIGRRLSEHLGKLGVTASFRPRTIPQLHTDIFIEQDFDIFIARTPPIDDPDWLRPLVHSTGADSIGSWHNPFGFVDGKLDAQLEEQRTTSGEARSDTVEQLQTYLFEHHPFSVVARPEILTAIGDGLPVVQRPSGITTATDLLRVGPDPVDGEPIDRFNVGLLNGFVMRDLNPLRTPYPNHPLVLELLYDPLVRVVDGEAHPWLAAELNWNNEGRHPAVTVSLRDPSRWHDGELLTSPDVAFTYRFMSSPTAGIETSNPVVTQYHAAASCIDTVEIHDAESLTITFEEIDRSLAARALQLPVLPQHHWSAATQTAEGNLPVAFTAANLEAIGSGPYRLEQIVEGESIVLSRVDEHFAVDVPVEQRPIPVVSIGINRIEFVTPSRPPTVSGAINQIAEGALDAVVEVTPEGAPAVVRTDNVSLDVHPGRAVYLIGFNCRRPPLDDRRFRRLIGRLIDRTFIVAVAFRGYGYPAESPLAGTEYLAENLVWSGQSQLGSFPGQGGILDEDLARALAADIGYTYETDTESLYQA